MTAERRPHLHFWPCRTTTQRPAVTVSVSQQGSHIRLLVNIEEGGGDAQCARRSETQPSQPLEVVHHHGCLHEKHAVRPSQHENMSRLTKLGCDPRVDHALVRRLQVPLVKRTANVAAGDAPRAVSHWSDVETTSCPTSVAAPCTSHPMAQRSLPSAVAGGFRRPVQVMPAGVE